MVKRRQPRPTAINFDYKYEKAKLKESINAFKNLRPRDTVEDLVKESLMEPEGILKNKNGNDFTFDRSRGSAKSRDLRLNETIYDDTEVS